MKILLLAGLWLGLLLLVPEPTPTPVGLEPLNPGPTPIPTQPVHNEPIRITKMNKYPICSVCGRDYKGYGNNAWPINPGRCCDVCNDIVLKHRILNVARGLSAYGSAEWYEELLKEKVAK